MQNSYGYISSHVLFNSTDGFLTTTKADQVIDFTYDNRKYTLNSLLLTANATNLKIKINNDPGILIVPANEKRAININRIEKITVLGALGQQLMFEGLYF